MLSCEKKTLNRTSESFDRDFPTSGLVEWRVQRWWSHWQCYLLPWQLNERAQWMLLEISTIPQCHSGGPDLFCFGGHAALSVPYYLKDISKETKGCLLVPEIRRTKGGHAGQEFLPEISDVDIQITYYLLSCMFSFCGSDSAAIFFSLQFMNKLALAKNETSTPMMYAHVGCFIAFPECTVCKKGAAQHFFSHFNICKILVLSFLFHVD